MKFPGRRCRRLSQERVGTNDATVFFFDALGELPQAAFTSGTSRIDIGAFGQMAAARLGD
jgi:hypothetical protein